MENLKDRVAVITGAARGQGRAHALRLAQAGADIVAIDVCGPVTSIGYELASPADLEVTASLVTAMGRTVIPLVADVRDTDAINAAVVEGFDRLGRIDFLVANAGIVGYAPYERITDEMWDDMVAINLTGVFKSVRATAPLIAAGERGGAIVLTSSLYGLRGAAHMAHYVASKHAVTGLAKAFATELAPQAIRVNSIHPTTVDTDMIHNQSTYGAFFPDNPRATRDDASSVARAMNLLDVDWVQSIDVANAVAFLLSDDARYITGTHLPIDAGGALK